jgi:hypothetical protein
MVSAEYVADWNWRRYRDASEFMACDFSLSDHELSSDEISENAHDDRFDSG